MKKRGISAVVATILIILIVVVGVGIVWKVILPIFQELEYLSYSDVQLNIVRQGFTVYDSERNFAFVQIERGKDEVNMTGVEIGFNFGGTTKTYQSKSFPQPNGKYTYKFNFTNDTDMGIPKNVTPDKVTVAPIFMINNKIKLGKILDSEDMPIGRIHMSAEEWEKANKEAADPVVVIHAGGGDEPGEKIEPEEPGDPFIICEGGSKKWSNGTLIENCVNDCFVGVCLVWQEVNKIMASDAQGWDQFGYLVSISGNYAIVGAYAEDEGDYAAGAAYIFKKNSTGQFEEVNKIMASDAQGWDQFGISVGISGDYAVIGARLEDESAKNAGAAYIFKKNSTGQFEEVNKIMASDAQPGDYFGSVVSISGDYTIVTAETEGSGGQQVGAAYIFKKNSTGQFEEIDKIQASDKQANDKFGESVSISGNYAIVGATGEGSGGKQVGAAYIFKKNSTGQFEEVNKIMASDKQQYDWFGSSVSISGDYALVSSQGEDTGGSLAGAAYIFKKNSTGQFEEVNKIQASDAQTDDYFGASASISGDYAVIGSQGEDTGGSTAGAAYIFKKNSTGQFEEVNKIMASDAQTNGRFGYSVSISGDNLLVSARDDSEAASGAGAAYVFGLS